MESRREQGQSFAEYAVLLVVVAIALVSMQTFVRRGLQAHVKSVADAVLVRSAADLQPAPTITQQGETLQRDGATYAKAKAGFPDAETGEDTKIVSRAGDDQFPGRGSARGELQTYESDGRQLFLTSEPGFEPSEDDPLLIPGLPGPVSSLSVEVSEQLFDGVEKPLGTPEPPTLGGTPVDIRPPADSGLLQGLISQVK